MPEENQTAQTPQTQQQPKKGGSNLAIILIIVFAVLIVLGVGGYFGWKYVISKYLKKATTTTASTNELSLKTLEALYSYPEGTITNTDRSKNSGAVSEITYESTDKLKTAYNYYLNLATKNNLTVSRKSLESDESAGSMTIQGSGYYVEISLFQYEKTDIYVSIFGDNIKNDTSATDSTTSSTTGSSSKTTISTDYVISDSNSRVISKSELTGLTPWQLKVARNEIYARHGRSFVHQDLQCYFNSKSWYSANPDFSESMLSTTENKNVATIQAYEQEINSPLQNKDSGC